MFVTCVVLLYFPDIVLYTVILLLGSTGLNLDPLGSDWFVEIPYNPGSTNPTVFTVLSHVGIGTGVGIVVSTVVVWVTTTGMVLLLDEASSDVCCGAEETGRPVFTDLPVIVGFMTKAMMRIKQNAITMYMISFLSMVEL